MIEQLKQLAADNKIDAGSVGIPTVSADNVLANGLNIAYFAAGVVCVIVIVIAAIMYTTGGANTENVTKAKNMLLYSIVGLVVVFIAFGLTWFIVGRI